MVKTGVWLGQTTIGHVTLVDRETIELNWSKGPFEY